MCTIDSLKHMRMCSHLLCRPFTQASLDLASLDSLRYHQSYGKFLLFYRFGTPSANKTELRTLSTKWRTNSPKIANKQDYEHSQRTKISRSLLVSIFKQTVHQSLHSHSGFAPFTRLQATKSRQEETETAWRHIKSTVVHCDGRLMMRSNPVWDASLDDYRSCSISKDLCVSHCDNADLLEPPPPKPGRKKNFYIT